MLKLYNTLTRKKEEFKPIKEGEVKMYACGPTVYDYPHIGNYRAYLFEDLLRRYLEYRGYTVTLVMNITDIDDKTIAASGGDKEKLKTVTGQYEAAFLDGLKILNVKEADVYPRATETIDEIVKLTERLIEKEFAYKTDDGSVYFSIDKYPDYGKLVHLNPKEMRSGERVSDDDYEKSGARDFALWKGWKEEDGEVYWETSLGKGRPGWHIECSAMSMKHLGESIDIHCGGIDNIFPHHENEIAQSESATGKKFVNNWVHCAHLVLEGEKMSKSLGNVKLLSELLEEGWRPEAIRFSLISAHYRSKLDLTQQRLNGAESNLRKISDFKIEMERVKGEGRGNEIDKHISNAIERFETGMDDDLNISEATAAIFDLIRATYILRDRGDLGSFGAQKVLGQIGSFNSVLMIMNQEDAGLEEGVKELIVKREDARKSGDWILSDEIRDRILELGYQIEDTPDGTIAKKR